MIFRNKIVLLAVIGTIIVSRFLYLGTIPKGLAPEEVKFGLILHKYFGEFAYSPFAVRLPSAILGTLTSIVFYKIALSVTKNYFLSLLILIFYAFSPWSISESRILSWGTLISFFTSIFVFYFLKHIKIRRPDFLYFSLLLSFTLLVLSAILNSTDHKDKVDFRRNISTRSLPALGSKVLINKYVESFHDSSGVFLGNFDFGNYFFAGYPRQRWGIEETQKLLPVFLPLLIIGIFKARKNENILYFCFFIIYSGFLTIFRLTEPSYGLPFLFIFSVILAKGFINLQRLYKGVFVVAFLFEFLVYSNNYSTGKTESMFSPRKAVYEDTANLIMKSINDYGEVKVDTGLSGIEIYLNYFLKQKWQEKISYSQFDYRSSHSETLNVIAVPYDTAPSEDLYKVNGIWPPDVKVIGSFDDKVKRQEIVVFQKI